MVAPCRGKRSIAVEIGSDCESNSGSCGSTRCYGYDAWYAEGWGGCIEYKNLSQFLPIWNVDEQGQAMICT